MPLIVAYFLLFSITRRLMSTPGITFHAVVYPFPSSTLFNYFYLCLFPCYSSSYFHHWLGCAFTNIMSRMTVIDPNIDCRTSMKSFKLCCKRDRILSIRIHIVLFMIHEWSSFLNFHLSSVMKWSPSINIHIFI